MSVKAQAEGAFLRISDTVSGLSGNLTVKDFGMAEAEALYPTHVTATDNGAILAWTHSYSKLYDAAITDITVNNEASLSPVDNTGVGLDNGKAYYLKKTVYIGLDSAVNVNAAATNLRVSSVSISANDDGKNLENSVRVLTVASVSTDSGTSFASASAYEVYGKGEVVKTYNDYKEGDVMSALIAHDGTVTDAESQAQGKVLLDSMNGAKVVKVDLYIYFDGRDVDCNSSMYDAGDVTVSVVFGATVG